MNENLEFAKGLRELAAFLEEHACPKIYEKRIPVHVWTREEFLAAAKAMGSFEKDYSNTYMALRKKFTGGVELDVQSHRATICEKVVVGEEEVQVPDPNAPKVTIKREKVEWRCDPLMAIGAA